MAYYSIFPEKDTTIYSHPDKNLLNTGNDEILELVKEKGSNNDLYYPSRILIQFSDSHIQTAINKSNQFTASLQLFSTEHKNLSSTQDIEIYPIFRIWNEGTGRFSNNPILSDGCSWEYRNNDTLKTSWLTSEFGVGSTGSIDNSIVGYVPRGGGEWYTGSGFEVNQTLTSDTLLDINANVTSILRKYSASLYASQTYPTGIPNYGFILKYSDNIETNISGSNGDLKYFSVDTHTIFPPKLTFKWDDSIHNFQSSAKTNGELNVSLYRNKEEYKTDEEVIFRLNVRDKYPNRTFVTSSNYLNVGYFTTASYYSIRDAHTEEIIIPFDDNCTKLSADNEGMYFKIFMNGLQPERYYRLLFKHINNDGTEIFDNNYHFKVVR